jgi:hypothetical protein
MTDKFEAEFYKAVDEVTHYMWDPIGVAGEPWARDEYHSYLPKLYRLMLDGKSEEAAIYLDTVIEKNMGGVNNPIHNRNIIEILDDWKATLLEIHGQ